MTQFLAFGVVGLVTGCIYALAASGLVLTYTTSGVFNFAHGAIGMVAAFAYWELDVNRGWPALVALLAVVLGLAPLLGATVERIVTRRLAEAPVVTSMVVTVGLLVALVGGAQAVWDPTVARTLPGLFGQRGFTVAGVLVTWDQVTVVLIAAAVAAGLRLLLHHTRAGVAMRAVVDDAELAALHGARPHRLAQLSWALGAGLAALAGILLAPLLQLEVLLLSLLVVDAFAAAMVGRLRSLPLTFAGAIGLGLAKAYAVGYLPTSDLVTRFKNSLPSLVLFAVLLCVPGSRLRGGRRRARAAPPVPTLGRSVAAAAALVGAAALVAPRLSDYGVTNVSLGLAYGLIMLSLVVLTGWGGQVSLCQMTFVGLGAFAMGRLGTGGSPLGLVAAAALAAAFGSLVALPALRLRGLELALATMAFAVLMDNVFFVDERVFADANLRIDRLRLPGVSFAGEQATMVLLAAVFALTGVAVLALRRGPFGRLLAAMRDSPPACATLGLDLTRTKLAVFALSAAIAGFAGALYGGLRASAAPSDFQMFLSLPLLLLAVVGGITTVSGALVGGMAYALLPVVQRQVPEVAGLAFLAAGAAAVYLGRNPDGLAGGLAAGWERLRRPREEVRPIAAPAR